MHIDGFFNFLIIIVESFMLFYQFTKNGNLYLHTKLYSFQCHIIMIVSSDANIMWAVSVLTCIITQKRNNIKAVATILGEIMF